MNTAQVVVFGRHDAATLDQIRMVAGDDRVAAACLCADGHKGYSMPIGGVAGYRGAISPSGVGYDIACGNMAVCVDIPAAEVRAEISRIMDDIFRKISFGMGRNNPEEVDHPLFDDPAFSIPAARKLMDKARAQLGTVGSGNHYVDLFVDEQDRVWIGVHFGSRGFGHGIATHFLTAAGSNSNQMDAPPCVLSLDTDLGQEYMACMKLAGRYAYAGREYVVGEVCRILGSPEILDQVHNHHNFAWPEIHGGEELIVVRKGATPSAPGQRGFVGGSMGDCSVVLRGIESEKNEASLLSTIHGAGRVMSRTQAAGKGGRFGKPRKGGEISREMMEEWVRRVHVELRGAGVDESPQCYRRLPDVLREHAGTVLIEHTLTPIGVAMAGENETDPYKD